MSRNPNRMAEAASVLMGKFALHASVAITYRDGNGGSVTLTATKSRTPYEESDWQIVVAHESCDYMVDASLLVIGNTAVTPENGHTITEADGTMYQVMMPKGMHVYERIGPDRSVLKIHTKGPM